MRGRPGGWYPELPARLAVLVGAVVLLASSGLGVAVGFLASSAVLDREATRQLAMATDLARMVEEDLLGRRRDVELIAGTIVDGDLDDSVHPLRRRGLERTLQTMLTGPSEVSWIGLTDAYGTVHHTSGLWPRWSVLPIQAWLQDDVGATSAVHHTHHLPLSARFPDPNGVPRRIVDVVAPVTDPTGRMIGVVAEHLPGSWLQARREARVAVDGEPDLHVLFLDHHGRLLVPADRRQALLDGVTDRAVGEPPVLGEPDTLLLAGGPRSSASLHTVAGGHDLLVAVAAGITPDVLEWQVAVVRPADAVLAGVRQVRTNLILFGLGAGAVTAVAAALAVRRSSRGLRAIDRAARAIRDGDGDAEMPLVEGRDDIATVSRSLRDLTDHLVERRAELERTERQLREALTTQDEFVAMASHEMRTPLTVIRGSLEVLDNHGSDLSAQQREDLLDAAERQLNRLERLARNLLLAQTVQAGGPSGPQPTPVEAFRPAVLLTGPTRGQHTLTGDPDLEVRGNTALLELTVGNLVDNAERYGRPPIEVAFALTTAAGRHFLEVTVRDHGEGVPPSFEPQLFGRFTQASQGLNRTPGGTGLGLWLSRQLLEGVGGGITHRRVDQGGAAFTVRLPVQLSTEPAPAPGVRPSAARG